MIATYKGKVIYSTYNGTPISVSVSQNAVDHYINDNVTWSQIIAGPLSGPNISTLVYDDGSPINDTDLILYSEVPGDADSSIVLEPAFYFKQNG